MIKDWFLAYSGHLNIDVVLKVDEINDNVTLPVSDVDETFGGTAGNFAMASHRVSLPFRLYSIVSNKSHTSYIEKLRGMNIDLAGVRELDTSFGPVCYAINDGNNQRYFLAEGPMKESRYEILDEKYDILHLGTGNPDLNVDLIENCKYGKLSFDPSQEVFYKYSKNDLNYFLEKCNFIFGNRREISFIFNKSGMDLESYAGQRHKVIMTDGENGSFLYGKNTVRIHSSGKLSQNVNTLGAGDSFRAGFYKGLTLGMNIERSMALGNMVSFNVVSKGLWGEWQSNDDLINEANKLNIEPIA